MLSTFVNGHADVFHAYVAPLLHPHDLVRLHTVMRPDCNLITHATVIHVKHYLPCLLDILRTEHKVRGERYYYHLSDVMDRGLITRVYHIIRNDKVFSVRRNCDGTITEYFHSTHDYDNFSFRMRKCANKPLCVGVNYSNGMDLVEYDLYRWVAYHVWEYFPPTIFHVMKVDDIRMMVCRYLHSASAFLSVVTPT